METRGRGQGEECCTFPTKGNQGQYSQGAIIEGSEAATTRSGEAEVIGLRGNERSNIDGQHRGGVNRTSTGGYGRGLLGRWARDTTREGESPELFEKEQGQLQEPLLAKQQKEDNLTPLKIIYLNARSLTNKINDLCILINDTNPDIILITETWCNEGVSTALLNIHGYNIDPELRLDRRDTINGIGGGLIVYSRDNLIIKPVSDSNEFNMFTRFDIINSCESKDGGRGGSKPNLSVTLVYRPPRSRNENIELLCKLFENSTDNSIIIGDFNFPSIDWKNLTADRNCESFLQCTLDNNYEQFIDFPTHVRGNTLDLVFTNRPENLIGVESLGNLGNSDHSILSIDLLFRSKYNHSDELIFDWKHGNTDGLSNYLSSVDWDNELSNKNTDDSWNFFRGKIECGMSLFIPKIPRRKANNQQWMTKQVKRLVRQKQRLYNQYQQNRTIVNYDLFKSSEKSCKKAVRSAKRKFEQSIAKNGNKRPFNSYIKSKTTSRVNVGPLKVGNELISDNEKMASLLNTAFSSVFTVEDTTDIPLCPPSCGNRRFEHCIFDADGVMKKIKKLKPTSSSGPDKISSRFLNDYVNILSSPLAIIFNKSLNSGSVPSDWKEANVTPIFKKGSKNSTDNYRPVSLTSIPCKIMESVLKDELTDYLLRNQLLKNTQHGFMGNKSCTTNLLEFMERITKHYDDGTPTDIIYLDFSKAFDKVPHKRLLAKMKGLGIGGNILKWTDSWLSNRKQRTVLNGSFSDWSEVISGVPQGSVLGPLLFVIFINDIDSCTENIDIMLKFADDTKLGHKASTGTDVMALQESIDKLLVWADNWSMKFNVAKCKVLHVGRTNLKHVYNMAGHPLLATDKEQDIGVIITDNLKPNLQCTTAARRASSVLTQISRAFMYRDKRTFLQLYKQFVRCHLEFAVPVWSPWLLGDIEVLEKVQKRALNMIVGLEGRSYEDKLSELNMTTLVVRRKRFDLIQTFKILNGLDKVDYTTWFTLVGDTPNRITRNTSYKKNLVATHSSTDIRKNFFTNRVVSMWNSLPIDVKESRTLSMFKSRLFTINLL